MKPLHGIIEVAKMPHLSQHQLACLGRAIMDGKKVRVRITPTRKITVCEKWVEGNDLGFYDKPHWQEMTPDWWSGTRTIERRAVRARVELPNIPVLVGLK